ncbi:hypothetical protein ACQPW1_29975 [Nocardia sp. CA-128927]|uniref:hypothetical protein n=1 Tax=Nocardia sp. CA-128927 TaxID=3239975 RepID=UPI003D98DE4A
MVIVLDTDQFDPCDRADVVASALQEVSVPAYIMHSPWRGSVYARHESWQFGQLRMHRAVMSGLAVARTPKQIRNSPISLLAVQLQQYSSVRLTCAETQHEIAPGQLASQDLDLPYEIDWRGGQGLSVFVSREQLGLSVETIRTALIRPQRSPLYRFLAKHMALTSDVGDKDRERCRGFGCWRCLCGAGARLPDVGSHSPQGKWHRCSPRYFGYPDSRIRA